MITLAILLCLIAPFLLAEAFFSSSEIAFLSANRPRLLKKQKKIFQGLSLRKDYSLNRKHCFQQLL